jgi:hypothetical protein
MNKQQRAMECIKRVHFHPTVDAAEEGRTHDVWDPRIALRADRKVGCDCHWLMAGSSSVVVVVVVTAARCRPGFEKGVSLREIIRELFKSRYRESHFFLSAQERLEIAQRQKRDGKILSVCFPGTIHYSSCPMT